MVRGEAQPAVQRPGRLVAVLNLEVEVRRALRGGPGGESRRHDGGQPAAPVRRVNLDGGQARPATGHGHPADGDRLASRPDRGEGLPGCGRQHLPGDRRQPRLAPVVVQGEPGVIGLRVHPDRHGRGPARGARHLPRRGGHHRGRAGPDTPALLREEAVSLDRLRPARRIRDGDHGGQAAGLVPVPHRPRCLVQWLPWIPDGQRAVRPSGEPAGGAQQPVTQPRFVGGPPAQRCPVLEVGDRDGHARQRATRDAAPVGPVMPELIREWALLLHNK
jgi:hypothetical protein